MSRNGLSLLQRDFLNGWFRRISGFFLTGGAVLVGFFKAPRITRDLDLFTIDKDCLEDGAKAIRDVCEAIGADLAHVSTARYFRRFLVRRSEEETLVDLVLDVAPQIFAEKPILEQGIAIDPPEEILANKICSVVGRSEPRDFLDIHFLAGMGFDIEDALKAAHVKDGGINEESLLLILSSIDWDLFHIPGCDPDTLKSVKSFFRKWSETLALRIYPKKEG